MQGERVSERRNVLYESQFALVNFSLEKIWTRMNAVLALFLTELDTPGGTRSCCDVTELVLS
jgi:hypothetical protein